MRPNRFFDEYKNAFFKRRKTFEDQEIPVKHTHELALQCLSSLMFLYFISKKRWLNNDPTVKFKDTKSLLQEELRIFTEILDERIIIHQKKIQTLGTEKKPVQRKLLKEEEREESVQKGLSGEQIKVLQQKVKK